MNPRSHSLNSIEQQLKEITHLISLPEVYLKIQRLMDDPSSDIDDFADVIRLDPNLITSVLKLVNSAFFGFPKQVDSVTQAINLIGIGQLHNMALGLSAIASLDLPNAIMPLKTFWRRSLYCGVLSRLLARELRIRQPERLFIMGLLHEIGHLVMYAKYPEHVRQALHIAQTSQIPINAAELQVLGCHYGNIGAMLMANWGLSVELQTATSLQPTPQDATEDSTEICLLHLAHEYAHAQITETDQTTEVQVTPLVWETTRLSPEQVDNCLDRAHTLSGEMERVLTL